jgi:hypothetical protein
MPSDKCPMSNDSTKCKQASAKRQTVWAATLVPGSAAFFIFHLALTIAHWTAAHRLAGSIRRNAAPLPTVAKQAASVAPTPKPANPDEGGRKADIALDRRIGGSAVKPSTPEEESFYLLIDHESRGPFPRDAILRRLREHQIAPDTLCRPTDSMDWVSVETLMRPQPDGGCSVLRRTGRLRRG